MSKKKVLFICTHNSARSQMAEGLLNALKGDEYQAYSAGTEKTFVKPEAIKVLSEIGIDISHHYSKTIDEFKDDYFDIVITVCDRARETCPFYPNADKIIHHSFADPSSIKAEPQRTEAFRRARDQIKQWIEKEF